VTASVRFPGQHNMDLSKTNKNLLFHNNLFLQKKFIKKE
jgi:hypothetical protein